MLDRALHFGTRVGWRNTQAHAIHHHYVRKIVADISDLRCSDTGTREDLFHDGNLFDVPLIDIGHIALLGALFGSDTTPPADHTAPYPLPGKPLQPDPVLRVEAFGLDDV